MSLSKEPLARALAKYCVANQAEKSIRLQMGEPAAKEWAEIRGATPIMGYLTEDEAFKCLMRWFHE